MTDAGRSPAWDSDVDPTVMTVRREALSQQPGQRGTAEAAHQPVHRLPARASDVSGAGRQVSVTTNPYSPQRGHLVAASTPTWGFSMPHARYRPAADRSSTTGSFRQKPTASPSSRWGSSPATAGRGGRSHKAPEPTDVHWANRLPHRRHAAGTVTSPSMAQFLPRQSPSSPHRSPGGR